MNSFINIKIIFQWRFDKTLKDVPEDSIGNIIHEYTNVGRFRKLENIFKMVSKSIKVDLGFKNMRHIICLMIIFQGECETMSRTRNQTLWIFSRDMLEKYNSSVFFGPVDVKTHRIERYECITLPPIQSVVFYRILVTQPTLNLP